MKTISLLLILVLVQAAYSQVADVFQGQCPNISRPTRFDLNRFMGTWYGYAGYENVEVFANTRNNYATYERLGGATVRVVSYSQEKNTCENVVTPYIATFTNVATLSINYNGAQRDFIVLDVDYDNWYTQYFCTNLNSTHYERILYIDTRDKFPSQEVIAAAEKSLADRNLSLNIVPVDQTECNPSN